MYPCRFIIKHLGTIAISTTKLFAPIKFLSTSGTKLQAPLPSIDSQRPSNSTSIATSVPAWEFTRPPTRRELTRWRRTYKRTSIVHHPPLEDSVAYINPFVPPFPTIKYSNSSSDRVPRYKTFARAPLSEVLCTHSHTHTDPSEILFPVTETRGEGTTLILGTMAGSRKEERFD